MKAKATLPPKDLGIYQKEFTRLNQEIKPVNIIAFDTEDDTKGTPVSCAFYSSAGCFYTTDMDEAIDYIYNIETPSVFVAHNLEYDIGNLFKHVDWKYIENMMYAGKLLRAGLVGSKHYFINSNSFFGGALAKMGESIGLPKLDGNVTNPAYVKRDAEIVYRFMDKFQKHLNEELQVNLGITIGQLSMAAYRRNYMQTEKQITFNSPNCLKAYYGGRVEIFYKGAIENIMVSDINSSYPNVMRNFAYPDTAYIEHSSIDTHEFGIGKFKVYVPDNIFVPVLPVKSKAGRLFFPTGEFTGWWTYPEVRYALTLGVKILKEFAGEGTKKGVYPFTAFIDDFYAKRMECRFNGDDFGVIFNKLVMNNLYGKWCQHKGGSTINREPMSAGMALRQKVTLDRKIGNFFCYSSERDEPPMTANFLWGVYVTAYARLELIKGLHQIHNAGGTIIYCDTDSIMFNGTKNPLSIGKKLGQWSEEKFDLGVFRQAKGYLLCNKDSSQKIYQIEKVACKGVNTNHAYDFIVRGMAKVMKPMRFKESIVRISADVNKDAGEDFEREMGVNVWREVEKTMTSIYVKRKGAGNIMWPVAYKDIQDIEDNSELPQRSIEKELKNQGYKIKRDRIVRKFKNIKIPADWFKRNKEKVYEVKHYESQKEKWIKSESCSDLKAGDIWFAGHVYCVQNGKYGGYYKILLENFRNKKAPNYFWGAFSLKFLKAFGVEENLVKKYLVITLKKDYIDNSDLVLGIEISESNICVQDVEEISDTDYLPDQETENLKSADWSFLNGIK